MANTRLNIVMPPVETIFTALQTGRYCPDYTIAPKNINTFSRLIRRSMYLFPGGVNSEYIAGNNFPAPVGV